MNCHSVKNVLDLFAEGRLTAGRLARIKEHLSACQPCSQEALAFARLRTPAKITAPAALKAKLAQVLAVPPAALPEREWSFGEGVPVLAGAAAYAALLIVLNLAGPGVTCEKYDASVAAGEFQ